MMRVVSVYFRFDDGTAKSPQQQSVYQVNNEQVKNKLEHSSYRKSNEGTYFLSFDAA